MPKTTLFVISLLVIIVTGLATVFYNVTNPQNISKNELDSAVNQAKLLFRQKQERGENLLNGPCLSNALMPDWVADLVHNPRLSIDDLPENQCPAFHENNTKHIIELDLNGNLIRAK